jgi:hypothetical protein
VFNVSSGLLSRWLDRAEALRAQALVTLFPRVGEAIEHGFRVDAEYFYPASTVKVCACFAALQLCAASESELGVRIELDTPYRLQPLSGVDDEPIASSSTIRVDIRRVCLVSDNPSFNRLFDLVGHQRLNESMHALGLTSVVMNHRLSDPRSIADHRRTAGLRFEIAPGRFVSLLERVSSLDLQNSGVRGLRAGRAHVVGDRSVDGPMDFSRRNRATLRDLHNLLCLIVSAPSKTGDVRTAGIEAPLMAVLRQAMTQYPRESLDRRFDPATYPDHAMKFLLPGLVRVRPLDEWRVTNKCGQAYGFSTDNALVTHLPTGHAAAVTATIYTNSNGVVGVPPYEYEEEAMPYFAALGEAVARALV